MAQMQYKFNKNDEYYTPAYAVYPIAQHIKEKSTVYCPFDTKDSEFVKVLNELGHNVIFGHIQDGKDFFLEEIPNCDYIISNPPYSLKNEVFKKLFESKIPFAMLINFQGIFDHKDRFKMIKNNRTEMLWLSPRVNYIKLDDSKSGVPFQSGYLCSGIFENQLNFESLKKSDSDKNV